VHAGDSGLICSRDRSGALVARGGVPLAANWTGYCGDGAWALRLSQELLPDIERVLGPDHPDTLATRSNIAYLNLVT
jgi:hypothetical protein